MSCLACVFLSLFKLVLHWESGDFDQTRSPFPWTTSKIPQLSPYPQSTQRVHVPSTLNRTQDVSTISLKSASVSRKQCINLLGQMVSGTTSRGWVNLILQMHCDRGRVGPPGRPRLFYGQPHYYLWPKLPWNGNMPHASHLA